MGLTQKQRAALFKGLEDGGWFWKKQFLYAPQETMWLLGSDPWQGDLADFHRRMAARLDRIEEQKIWASIPENNAAAASDTGGLVAVLRGLIDRSV